VDKVEKPAGDARVITMAETKIATKTATDTETETDTAALPTND